MTQKLTEEDIEKVTGGDISSDVIGFVASKVFTDPDLASIISKLSYEQGQVVVDYLTSKFDGLTLAQAEQNYELYKAETIAYIKETFNIE